MDSKQEKIKRPAKPKMKIEETEQDFVERLEVWRELDRAYMKQYLHARRAKETPEQRQERLDRWNEWYLNHLEYRKIWAQKYYGRQKYKIKEQRRSYMATYMRRRRQEDPLFSLTNRLRVRLNEALQGKRKSKSVLHLIGCDISELKQHLENQFLSRMSWENRELWHIDHIQPVSSFDLSDIIQQYKCFHYSNLQPLWAADNIRKRDKIL